MESELWPALEDVEDSIDSLSTTLKPLLEQTLPKNASLLPLVDKAKLYILTTYAIESLIFSYLDLSSTPTKDHPIMKELTRVRQYFQKIRDIEAKDSEKQKQNERDNLVLDKEAAGRFIKSALMGNDRYDAERAENVRLQKERAHIKFAEMGEAAKDPIGKRAESSDEEEKEGVRLVTGDTDYEGEMDEDKPKTIMPKQDAGDSAEEDEATRKQKRKEEKRKRKRELAAMEGVAEEKREKKTKKEKGKGKEKKKDKSNKT